MNNQKVKTVKCNSLDFRVEKDKSDVAVNFYCEFSGSQNYALSSQAEADRSRLFQAPLVPENANDNMWDEFVERAGKFI